MLKKILDNFIIVRQQRVYINRATMAYFDAKVTMEVHSDRIAPTHK